MDSDANKALENIAQKVLFNDAAFSTWAILDHILRSDKVLPNFETLKMVFIHEKISVDIAKIVYHQAEGYNPKDNGEKVLCRQGYQLAEPWNGNIAKAPILFLSSNPGFSANEHFPRYHYEDGVFSWQGLPADGRVPENTLTKVAIRNFFEERFENVRFVQNKKNPAMKYDIPRMGVRDWTIESTSECIRPVVFWNKLWKIADNLLPLEKR